MNQPKMACRNVWKLYGPDPDKFLAAHDGEPDLDTIKENGYIPAVRDASLEVHEGELVVLMGLSGSGKSTLVRCMSRLIEPTAGEIEFDGEDLRAASERELVELRRHKMGMVFQHFALFPHRNIIDNTAYGLKVQGVDKPKRQAAAIEALAMVGLEAYAFNSTRELSGGMQQRVGLARALCSNPDILLMDEAFSALDPLIRRQMQDELMAIQDKVHKTILFITHDLNEALRMGSRICILRDGLVIQIGTPEEILTEPADGYVAEFVQDVDQGRVIDVGKVMHDAVILDSTSTLTQCVDALGDRQGGFVVDADNRPTAMLSLTDAATALAHGTTDLGSVLRSDFDTTTPGARFNENYAAAGRGQPIAVVDESGRLIGELEPREIMEEMGRVELLVDGFEREMFL